MNNDEHDPLQQEREALQQEREDTMIREAGESGKAFRREPLATIAERAAEMAYRRGFVQGLYVALRHWEGQGRLQELRTYATLVGRWRSQGDVQKHTEAATPPPPPLPPRRAS